MAKKYFEKVFSGFTFAPCCQALFHGPLGESCKIAAIESFIFLPFSCYCTMPVMLATMMVMIERISSAN